LTGPQQLTFLYGDEEEQILAIELAKFLRLIVFRILLAQRNFILLLPVKKEISYYEFGNSVL
jgi:hypothetical protein